MKTKLLFSLFFIASFAMYAQVPQIPLVEHFTQASCGPCASQNPILKTTLDNFGTSNYVRVSHQTSWPGVDPMNAVFPAGPDVRRLYYGVSGVPNTTLNGAAVGAPNSVVTTASLTSAFNNTTPYDITATQTWSDANTVTVNIDVANVTGAPISTANRIYVAMVENTVTYPTAPGSNGETTFEYVMRQMYNASTGAANATAGAVLGTIPANSTTNFNFTLTNLPSYIDSKGEITFAVYIQNNATRQILQAGKSSITSIPGLVAVTATSTTVADSGLCDFNITPSIEFTNNDTNTAVTNVVAQYTINRGTPVQQTYSGNLTSGQSINITFPTTTLISGTNTVTTEIVSVNGGQDWLSSGAVDIADQVYTKLNNTSVSTPLFEGMENAPLIAGTGYSRDLTTAVFEANVAENLFSVLDGPTYNYGAIGGFAASNRSIRFRYYDIPNGAVMSLTSQKFNLGTNSTLTFNHAYRQYINENDALEVFISTDCGVSWTSVFSAAGTALSTLPASTALYHPGGATDWRANNVDLSAYNNTSDVIIRFEGTSGFGNNLFIDDITIDSILSSEDVNALSSVKIYPNPSSDFITVSGLLDTQNYSIFNMLGAQVKKGTLINNDQININEYAEGLYILKLENGQVLKFIKE